MLEIWGKNKNFDKIVYGDTSMKKITKNDFQGLINVIRVPLELTPDPRVVKEDAADLEKYERDMKERAERLAEAKKIKEAQDKAKREDKELKR